MTYFYKSIVNSIKQQVNIALVDCAWGGWSSYGQCNSCQQYRSRTVITSEKNNGTCNGLGRESKPCGTSK